MTEVTQETGEAQLSRYCRRCHRKLRSEKALRAGYGRVCASKVLLEGT